MNEKKLTDEEIIKVLEICAKWQSRKDCAECPLNNNCRDSQGEKLYLDLINRQKAELAKELAEHEAFTKKAKAEIERLTEYAEMFERGKIGSPITMDKMLALEKDKIELQKQVDELTKELETKKKECREIADDYQEMGTFYYNETVKTAELQKQVADLKEERENMQSVIFGLEEEKRQLQKQVDELTDKLGKVLLGVKSDELLVAKGVEQAVKDTAREILQMLYDDRNGYWDSCDCGKDETYWRDNSIQGTLNEIKERYGVEVE